MLKKLHDAAMIFFVVAITACFVAIPFAIYHDFHKIGLVG